MVRIVAIESSGRNCSVALSENGECVMVRELTPQAGAQMEHSALLAPFIAEILETRGLDMIQDVDAVAISAGPGSYTGLRIGLATAKGICFGADKPLIAVDSLSVLINCCEYRCELMCPMVDARRMEVYTKVVDCKNGTTTQMAPLVVDEESFAKYATREMILFGSGAAKCLSAVRAAGVNARVVETEISARGLCGVAEKKFIAAEFVDVAYFEPLYLKEFLDTRKR